MTDDKPRHKFEDVRKRRTFAEIANAIAGMQLRKILEQLAGGGHDKDTRLQLTYMAVALAMELDMTAGVDATCDDEGSVSIWAYIALPTGEIELPIEGCEFGVKGCDFERAPRRIRTWLKGQ